MISIHCFGPLRVHIDDRPLEALHVSRTLCTLLGYLLVHRGQAVERSRLAGTFWPDSPERQARRNLNSHLWRLRRLMEGTLAEALHLTKHTVGWYPPAGTFLDLQRFEEITGTVSLADATLIEPGEVALSTLEEAAALYRAPLLDDCEELWCEVPRRRYHERYMLTLESLIHGYRRREQPARALHYANLLVQTEPYYEPAHRAVIELQLKLGRPQEARTACEHYLDLWEELGLPPSNEVSALLYLSPTQSSQRATAALPQESARALGQLVDFLGDPALPAELETTVGQERQLLLQTVAEVAGRLGEASEAIQAWGSARRCYEIALLAVEQESPTPAQLRRQIELRLRCDTLYDRTAERATQAENLYRAATLAERLGDPALQSEIWARQCWLAQRENRLEASIQFAKRAISLATPDSLLHAQAIRLAGTSYQLMGRYNEALTYHKQALALDADHPAYLRLDHNNLASVYQYRGQPWQAREHALAALALTSANPPSLVRAIALGNLAISERELGDFNEASTHLHQALDIARRMGSRLTEIWLICRIATLYRWLALREDAGLWASRAWALAREIQDPMQQMEAALELVSLLYEQREMVSARRWLARAEELLQNQGMARHRGALARLQATLYLEQEPARAARTLERARRFLERSGESRQLMVCYALSARIALLQEDREAAESWFARAVQCLEEQGRQIPEGMRQRFLAVTPLRHLLATSPRDALAALGEHELWRNV